MRPARTWMRPLLMVGLSACVSLGCGDSAGAGPTEDAAESDSLSGDSAEDDASSADSADAPAADTELPPEVPLGALWGPGVAEDLNPAPGVVEVHLEARTKSMKLLGIKVDMMAFGGQLPGPTIHARIGDELIVHFDNALDEPTTIHWHGLRVPNEMDGTPRVQDPVPAHGSFTYRFTLRDAGTFWYHPHIRTNVQIEKGLYGALVVAEATDPPVTADRVIFVDDILLTEAGMPPFNATMMEQMHGRLGNTLLTNGVAAEPLQATAREGDVERWRILNPSNARTIQLGIEGARWRVVGTDGGLLPVPYSVDRLTVAVGQRYDLEVSYDAPGTAKLISWVATLDANDQVVDAPLPVVEVAVAPGDGPADAIAWPPAVPLPEREPNAHLSVEIDVVQGANGLEWRLNKRAMWMDPLFTATTGDTVRIQLFNRAGPEHPFHLHGQFFEIVRRNAELVTDEPGLKDTVLIPGMESVELRAYLDNPGRWMAHCHILEHAELGMMAEIWVVDPE